MCSAIGAIGEGVLTNHIRLCILDMSENVEKIIFRDELTPSPVYY